ncbi:MAG: hypothetical protein DME22_25390 [Verrucomicrobia bacterium]|nr:MAG: hypothetical protein DME22_25390 [Verrucomicrobiota bacterium]
MRNEKCQIPTSNESLDLKRKLKIREHLPGAFVNLCLAHSGPESVSLVSRHCMTGGESKWIVAQLEFHS